MIRSASPSRWSRKDMAWRKLWSTLSRKPAALMTLKGSFVACRSAAQKGALKPGELELDFITFPFQKG